MRNRLVILLLCLSVILAFTAAIFWGSVSIPAFAVATILTGGQVENHPAWTYIVLQSRLPMALTALLCGASLAAAGLMLQTALRNPMAGPNILGIDSGANLGVALVMLPFGGSALGVAGMGLVIGAALLGAMAVMGLLLLLNRMLRSSMMLLIAGIMLGYIASSVISLLNFRATQEGVHAYVMWGMGSFANISEQRLPVFVLLCLLGLLLCTLLIKPLNALLLGERYAHNLGIPVRRTRTWLLLATGLLTAVCTAFCGPITFIGLAVPHIARMLLDTANHRTLLPATMLCGALIALICCVLSTLPGESGVLPINVLTPIIGAPIVIYVLLKLKIQ